MKHALALLLLSCCALVAQPNSNDSNQKRAAELRRMIEEGKITQADLTRMFEEGKISPTVMLMTNVADDAAPTPQAKPAAKVTKAAAAEAPKPAAEATNPKSAAATAEYLMRIPPINVRDELIELIHLLKADARELVHLPTVTLLKEFANDAPYQESLKAGYDARMKAKTEAQRLLLQALVELAKEAEKKEPTKAYHSSNPLTTGMSR